MLNARRLQVFGEVARAGSASAAARVLGISHQAVSRQICELEDDLGMVLFRRSGNQLLLTEAGLVLNERVDELNVVLRGVADDLSVLRADGVAAQRVLRLAMFPSTMGVHIATELPARCDPTRGQVTVRTSLMDNPWRAFHEGRADAVLAYDLDRAESGHGAPVLMPIVAEPTWVVLPSTHELAGRPTVALADLRRERWIAQPAEAPLRRFLEASCLAAGFRAVVAHETTSTQVVIELIKAGEGITLCTPTVRSSPDYVLRPLRDGLPRRIVLAHQASGGLNDALRELPAVVAKAYWRIAAENPDYHRWLTRNPGAFGSAEHATPPSGALTEPA